MRWLLSFILIIQINASMAQSLLEWNPVDSLNNNLPEEIMVFVAKGRIDGDTITAYYSKTNIRSGNYVFYPLYSEVNIKPEVFFAQNDDIFVLTNGGYFGPNASYSLVLNNYETLVPNIRAVTRTHNGQSYTYYPTRSAFGVKPDVKMEAAYVYTMSNTNLTYAYPEASPNTTAELPLPQPTPDYPEGGNIWNVSEAIGGGPLLIRDSAINSNYTPELFYSDITSSKAPRTAIGYTSDGYLINLVVDGRQTHSQGVTLQRLSDILLELGCVEAINLDGGGSSVMMVNDGIINLPSDGTTRNIPSVVTVKKAFLKDTDNEDEFQNLDWPVDTLDVGSFGESGTLIYGNTSTGMYYFSGLEAAKYRIEAYYNNTTAYAFSDSVVYLLSNGSAIPDSIYIDQSQINETGFVFLGYFHLTSGDSLVIVNLNSEDYVQVDAVRLIKTGSSLPTINLVGDDYTGEHANNESLNILYNAASQHSARPLNGIKIEEKYNNITTVLKDSSFDPATTLIDSLLYIVPYESGSVTLSLTIFDVLSDSASINYHFDIDNTNPLIAFGIHSVLEGNVGDSLVFQLIMASASLTRELDHLLIMKYSGSNLEAVDTISLNGFNASVYHYHEIEESDFENLKYLFKIYDDTDYSSELQFDFSAIQIMPREHDSNQLYFDHNSNMLYYKNNAVVNKKAEIDIYNLMGKRVFPNIQYADDKSSIDLSQLIPGIYIALLSTENGREMYKFMKIK